MLSQIIALMIGFVSADNGLVMNQPYQIVDRYCSEGPREARDKNLASLVHLAFVFKPAGKMDMINWSTNQPVMKSRYERWGDRIMIVNTRTGERVDSQIRTEGEIVTLSSKLPAVNPQSVCVSGTGALVMVLKPVSVK